MLDRDANYAQAVYYFDECVRRVGELPDDGLVRVCRLSGRVLAHYLINGPEEKAEEIGGFNNSLLSELQRRGQSRLVHRQQN